MVILGVSDIQPIVALDRVSIQSGIFSQGSIISLLYGANVSLTNSDFSNITGRGVYHSKGSLTVHNSSFLSNINEAEDGGGIYIGNAENVDISRSYFKDNHARRGGAIWSADRNTKLNSHGNTYIDNRASTGHGHDLATVFTRFQLISTEGLFLTPTGPIEIYSGDSLPTLSYAALDLYDQIISPQPTDQIVIGGTRITNVDTNSGPSRIVYQGLMSAFLSGNRSYSGTSVLGKPGSYQFRLSAIAEDGISYSDDGFIQPLIIKECGTGRALVDDGMGGLSACKLIVCSRGCDLRGVGNGFCTAPDVCSCKPGREGFTCDLPAGMA